MDFPEHDKIAMQPLEWITFSEMFSCEKKVQLQVWRKLQEDFYKEVKSHLF